MSHDRSRGLNATELALVLDELRAGLVEARVRDVALVAGRDDLLIVMAAGGPKMMLHVALGAERSRLCLTARRFPKGSFTGGPRAERLRKALLGCGIDGIEQPAGERRCRLRLVGDGVELALEVELFGNRGLWCLVDSEGRILELSRPARGLVAGARYEPPRGRQTGGPVASRFSAPVLEAVDRHFTGLDRAAEEVAERQRLRKLLGARRAKLESRLAGLARQLEQIATVDELRRQADLMLAHGHEVDRGARAMTVPDPEREGQRLRFELDPARSVVAQAEALYERARRLAHSAAVAEKRQAEARTELAELELRETQLAAGALPEVASALASTSPRPAQKARPSRQRPAAEFRRFTSLEGHAILVGRNRVANDRLSLRIARGNDLWVHVGGGRAGSHVVVRLPRGKTASLETLLDAGTLAVHFSPSRGSPLCEVLYTQAKHLRKPKGLGPGKVLVNRSRTLRVRLEPDRLDRLLRSAGT